MGGFFARFLGFLLVLVFRFFIYDIGKKGGATMYGNQYLNQQMQGMYTDPYSARLAAMQQPQMQAPQSYDIIQVHGEPGARAFRMAPNSRCLLLDDTAPIIWLAQTDGAGYPTLTPYSITPYQPEQPAQVNSDIENRLARLEAVIYGKPDASATQSAAKQSTDDVPSK